MYFSNILLLLLISTFTSSMRSPPRYNELQEEIQPAQEIQPAEEIQQADEVQSAEGGIPSEYDLIPFSLSYSEVIEQFIKKMTKKFHVATSGKIRMKAQSLIDSLKSNQPNGKLNFKINFIDFKMTLTSFKNNPYKFVAENKLFL